MSIIEAEYTLVQERTLPVIIGEIKIIEHNVAKTAMEGAIQIGQRLQEAKTMVGHGNFENWCKENLNYSKSSAERFMKIASEYGGENGLLAKTSTLTDLSISNALSLLKLPEDEREKFIENHPVGDMTNKALEDEIKQLKAEKDTADREYERVSSEKIELEKDVARLSAVVTNLQEELAEAEAQPAEDQTGLIAEKEKEAEALKVALAKAEADLQKTKEGLERKKKELKAEKDGQKAAVERQLLDEKQKIRKEEQEKADARMKDLQEMKNKLETENKVLQQKLAKAGNNSLVKFKILVDQLQENFDLCGSCVLDEQDHEMATKMNAALKQIVEGFLREL